MARSRRGTVRSASKVQEAELLQRVRALRDHPEHVIPECEGSCVFLCPFKAARKHAAKAQLAADDQAKLKKLATSGPRLGRAYAAALLAAHSDKVTHLANARLPYGTYAYIYRGKAAPQYHVAVQHHPDPRLRLLGAREEAVKRRLVVYAVGDHMVSTHGAFDPPEAFVTETLERLRLKPRDESTHTCPHPTAVPALVLDWLSAGCTLRICQACATERSSLALILERMAAKRPSEDFRVRADLAPIEGLDEDGGAAADAASAAYLKGALTDLGFLARAEAERRDALATRPGLLLVLGRKAYRDLDEALADLDATDAETRALRAALADVDRPVIVDRASAALILEDVWEEAGEAALSAALGDATVAGRAYDPDLDAGAIKELLQEAASEAARRDALAALPSYGRLPAAARVAHEAARAYRTGGKDAALRVVTGRDTAEGAAKGAALAVVRFLGEEGKEGWRFSDLDREAADVLGGEVQTLLAGDPAAYHDALDALSRKLGEGDLPKPKATGSA